MTSAGAVGVFVDGVDVRTVVSQGCRPVGQPYVVTRSEGNRIEELAGRAAIERVQDTASEVSEEDRSLMRAGLHLGVVVDEHRTDFRRGDFLVRNVLGGDQATGAIVVGDDVAVGQTVQFHVRDAAAADEDLRELLSGVEAEAALLFTCNGRGRRFFGVPDHDAGVLDQLLGPAPGRGRVLRRRDRAGRGRELPARLHRQRRVVLTVSGDPRIPPPRAGDRRCRATDLVGWREQGVELAREGAQ